MPLNQRDIKPLSTTSPAAIAAVQMVTPMKLSNLLLEKGPLAIRHITQTLSLEIPSFEDLSSSKQRRLIMSVMESGDEENRVVFEKIGWGQWSAKVIDDPTNFIKIRDFTNNNNAKIKDMISQESQRRRRKSNSAEMNIKFHSDTVVTSEPKEQTGDFKVGNEILSSRQTLYIDENTVISEDENNDDMHDYRYIVDEDEESNGNFDLLKIENDSNYHYRSNNKSNNNYYTFTSISSRRKPSIVITETALFPKELDNDVYLPRKLKPVGKYYTVNSMNRIPYRRSRRNSFLQLQNPYGNAVTTNENRENIKHIDYGGKIDLEKAILDSNKRPEHRRSVSNESSIRSTLVASKENLTKKNMLYSDTDEEDWAAIGAMSLRSGRERVTALDFNSSSFDDNNAACLLMSLRS